MNLLIKSAEKLQRGAVLTSGIQQEHIRAFINDLTITEKSVSEERWILEDLVELTNLARMEFKPEKYRSLVLRKGHIQDRFRFRIKDTIIPTVLERSVKSLGKWYRADLNNKQSVREIQVDTWMTSLEKCGLPGKYKAWGYQHGATNMPVTSVIEEYKATMACQAMMLRDHKDERVCQDSHCGQDRS